jgi:hypothetical protein
VKRSYAIIVKSVIALAVFALFLLAIYPRFKKIEKRGPPLESAAAILPVDMDTATRVTALAFNDWSEFNRPSNAASFHNKFPSGNKWSRFFLFYMNDLQYPLFPSDQQILLDRGTDTFIERYVHVPPELRSHDLYLYEPTADYYWPSEYFYQGQPAKFRCSFFIHLEPADDHSTKVEIFEYQPTIWAGECLGLSAHALLPTTLHDIRPVQSTTADRNELLQIIRQAVH